MIDLNTQTAYILGNASGIGLALLAMAVVYGSVGLGFVAAMALAGAFGMLWHYPDLEGDVGRSEEGSR